MILLALALAAAPAPSLDAAIRDYAALVTEAQRTGDTRYVDTAADTVCRIAYTNTVVSNDTRAVDAIVNYQGPNADRLKLTCSIFFQVRGG